MKQIKAVVVGAGNRGKIYASYSLISGGELKIVGVVDPVAEHAADMASEYGVPKTYVFNDVDEFLKANIECDLVINATMDSLHFSIDVKLLEAGYNVLTEKPVTPEKAELLRLRDTANKKGVNLFVCHVLRYTPFYKHIKQDVLDGKIGKITAIEMSEHVCNVHYVESYVVGKWRSEKECGSTFLLAKSCHDTDLMCWLNNATEPEEIASFGDRKIFVPENAPEGHTDTCHTCPCEKFCKYSTNRIFFNRAGWWRDRLSLNIKKPQSEITEEDIQNEVKKSSYGKCVFEDKDLLDRQNMIVKFKNGSIGTFNLIAGSAKGERYIHIVGEDGEISGALGDNKYLLRRYDFMRNDFSEEVIDVTVAVEIGAHSGGDTALMHDICAYLRGDKSSISITNINDSVNGHLLVYAADESQKQNKIVKL